MTPTAFAAFLLRFRYNFSRETHPLPDLPPRSLTRVVLAVALATLVAVVPVLVEAEESDDPRAERDQCPGNGFVLRRVVDAGFRTRAVSVRLGSPDLLQKV